MICLRTRPLVLDSLLTFSYALFAATPKLKVSDNLHFLIAENGAPFFWQGDIFHAG